jgi:hypothetical protein
MASRNELQDPLLASARLRDAVRRTSSRVLGAIGRRLPTAPAHVSSRAPVLDYRAELTGAPVGRALLSYLAEPFHHPPDYSLRQDYSNWTMSLELANALNRLGFAVDIINYDDYGFRPTESYAVFMGMAANFSRLLPMMSKTTRTVYWATRPDAAFEMEAIRQRQLALYVRRKQWIPATDALMPLLESADYHRADALLLIGNDTIRSTFRTPSPHVYCIDNPALSFPADRPPRDLSEARRNFLFLSSWLLIRKGLDVVLETFAARPHLDLWICGPVDAEPAFLHAYRQELFYTANIHPFGWVAMQSPTFLEISRRCGYLVFPSCAEGMSGSVLNGMANGLVPICTLETGVDLGAFGLPVLDSSPAGLGAVIDRAAAIPPTEFRERSDAAQAETARRYTVANFRSQVEVALRRSILGG